MRIDQDPAKRGLAGYIAALLSGIVMGATWVIFKLELNVEALGPVDVNWLNMLAVAMIIWPVYLVRHRGSLFTREQPWKWLAAFAGTAAAIFYLRNLGVDLCGATTSAIVSRTETGFVFILSYAILGEVVSPLGWLGTLLLLAGALRASGIGAEGLSFPLIGVGALVLGAALIAINGVIIKSKFNKAPNELLILASATVQSIVFTSAGAAFVGGDGARAVLADPRLIGLVMLAALAISGNLFLYYYAMKRAPMWAVRILALVAMPAAVAGDYFVLGQPITPEAVQGMGLVMAGAMIVIHAGRRRNGDDGEQQQDPARKEQGHED